MERDLISLKNKEKAIELVVTEIGKRLEQYGDGAFVSPHEALGDLTEEYHEFVNAVRENDPVKAANEACDIAVSAFWHLASTFQKEENLKASLEAQAAELSQ